MEKPKVYKHKDLAEMLSFAKKIMGEYGIYSEKDDRDEIRDFFLTSKTKSLNYHFENESVDIRFFRTKNKEYETHVLEK